MKIEVETTRTTKFYNQNTPRELLLIIRNRDNDNMLDSRYVHREEQRVFELIFVVMKKFR